VFLTVFREKENNGHLVDIIYFQPISVLFRKVTNIRNGRAFRLFIKGKKFLILTN